MKRCGITAAGTWTVDYTKIISQFPQEGACTSILSETVNNGGAPYSLLVDLCRLGAPFPLRAIGCIGRDVDGASILKECQSHGFDTRRMKVVSGEHTSFSDVMATSGTGVRTSFNQAGANTLLNESAFDFKKDPSRIFYLGSLFFLKGLDAVDPRHGTKAAAVLASARKTGLLTCVDIERTPISSSVFFNGGRAALHETDLVILNVEVAEILTEMRIRYPAGVELVAAEEAAHKLLAIGRAKCAVIRFPTGALALSSHGPPIVEGSARLPPSRLVNAAGAGHAFAAGFLYQYHEEKELSDCLKAGHGAAAMCLMDRAASGGIKGLCDGLSLLERFGQRESGISQPTRPIVSDPRKKLNRNPAFSSP
ncbi:hypothetical protein BH09VER1_BH09VER1_47810 [soil metagenome]